MTHEFPEGDGANDPCRHCGVLRGKGNGTSCIFRREQPAPRGIPQSIFADLGEIGDRLTEIAKEEGRSPPPAEQK